MTKIKNRMLEGRSSIGLNQRRTHRLEGYIYRLSQRMSDKSVVLELAACHTPISDNTVGRIDQRLAQDYLPTRNVGRVVAIGIDDYAVWSGHRYATIITNPLKQMVLETFLGRDKATVVAHLKALFPTNRLKLAVMDMNGSYQQAVIEALPHIPWGRSGDEVS